jgi:hypothetical protein
MDIAITIVFAAAAVLAVRRLGQSRTNVKRALETREDAS